MIVVSIKSCLSLMFPLTRAGMMAFETSAQSSSVREIREFGRTETLNKTNLEVAV